MKTMIVVVGLLWAPQMLAQSSCDTYGYGTTSCDNGSGAYTDMFGNKIVNDDSKASADRFGTSNYGDTQRTAAASKDEKAKAKFGDASAPYSDRFGAMSFSKGQYCFTDANGNTNCN
jgi:hypothetical protein